MRLDPVTGPPWPGGGLVIDLDSLDTISVADLEALERRAAPSVAAVRGPCVGAALAVAMAADLVIAGPDAGFGRAGAWTDVVIRRGTGIMGRKGVALLTMTDRLVGSEIARRWGLVSRVVDDPIATAHGLIDAVGQRAPVAVATVLRQAHRGAVADYICATLTGPGEPEALDPEPLDPPARGDA